MPHADIFLRVPLEIDEAVRDRAEHLNMTRQQFIRTLLADRLLRHKVKA